MVTSRTICEGSNAERKGETCAQVEWKLIRKGGGILSRRSAISFSDQQKVAHAVDLCEREKKKAFHPENLEGESQ